MHLIMLCNKALKDKCVHKKKTLVEDLTLIPSFCQIEEKIPWAIYAVYDGTDSHFFLEFKKF